MPSQETTCKTKYVFILAAIAAAKQHYLQDAGDNGDKAWHINPNEEMLQDSHQADDHNDDDNALFQGFDAELLNDQNQIGADSDFIPANSTSSKAPNFGGAPIYKIEQPGGGPATFVSVPDYEHYMFRGEGLARFNFLEYSCSVEIVRIAKPGSKHADERVDDNSSEHGDDAEEENEDDSQGLGISKYIFSPGFLVGGQ
jgi:hypothetical protein